MLSSPIKDNSLLKEVSYFISVYEPEERNFALLAENVLDVQLTWTVSDIMVEGYAIFNDTTRISEVLPPLPSMYFKIVAKDRFDATFEQRFIITRIDKSYDNGQIASVRFELVDEYYFYFTNLYISKGYKNKTITEIIYDITRHPVLSQRFDVMKNAGKLKPINVFKSKEVYSEFVIPQNRSFANFIYNRELIDGFCYVHSRNNITLVNYDMIGKATNLSEQGLKLTSSHINKHFSPFEIRGFNVVTMDRLTSNTVFPTTRLYSFDFQNKGVFFNENVFNKSGLLLESDIDSEIYLDNISTIGYKTIEAPKSHSNIIDRLISFKLIENIIVEVDVSGLFMYNLFTKIGLDVNNTVIQQSSNKMPYINGDYFILKIVDKFQGNIFNQKITLGKTGVTNA